MAAAAAAASAAAAAAEVSIPGIRSMMFRVDSGGIEDDEPTEEEEILPGDRRWSGVPSLGGVGGSGKAAEEGFE